MEELADKAVAILLLSLRLAPALAFSPPFTLLRVPATVRVMLAISLAAWLAVGHSAQTWQSDYASQGLFLTAAGELFLGIALALTLQLAFAALLTMGRMIDIQAGFGMAMLVDPTTRTQVPLVGTLLVYAAAAIFFATDGPADLLAIWAGSVDEIPLGAAFGAGNPAALAAYVSTIFVMAFGVAGLTVLMLFLTDLALAFMSRTLPQMNVLMLGFQVKTLVALASLPLAMALSGALLLRMIRYALAAAPGML